MTTNAIARILQSKNTVGFGMSVGHRQVITAAHVINLALGRPMEMKEPLTPGASAVIDFPRLTTSTQFSAVVARWRLDRDWDIATLVLDETTEDIPAAVLSIDRDNYINLNVRFFGYPAGSGDLGGWIRGTIVGDLGKGRMQINCRSSDKYEVRNGFSGSPVWLNDEETVVGMILNANEYRQTCEMISSSKIVKRFAFEQPQRGTDNWKLHFFRESIMHALLLDLSANEREGLPQNLCDKLYDTFNAISVELSVLEDIGKWEKSIRDEFNAIRDLYLEWNNHSGGDRGLRSRTLIEILEKKKSISSRMLRAQPLAYRLDWHDPIDNIVDHIWRLIAADRSNKRFCHTKRSLHTYTKRKD